MAHIHMRTMESVGRAVESIIGSAAARDEMSPFLKEDARAELRESIICRGQ